MVVVVVVMRGGERARVRDRVWRVIFFGLLLLGKLAHMPNNDTPEELVKLNNNVGTC